MIFKQHFSLFSFSFTLLVSSTFFRIFHAIFLLISEEAAAKKSRCRQLLGMYILLVKMCCHLPTIFRFKRKSQQHESFAKMSVCVYVTYIQTDTQEYTFSRLKFEFNLLLHHDLNKVPQQKRNAMKTETISCEKFMIGRYVNRVVIVIFT